MPNSTSFLLPHNKLPPKCTGLKQHIVYYCTVSMYPKAGHSLAGPSVSRSPTRLQSMCQPWLWYHMKVQLLMICFQTQKMGIFTCFQFLTACWTEAFSSLLTVGRRLFQIFIKWQFALSKHAQQ